MKLLITSRGEELGSQIDERFGRGAYFAIVDTDTMEIVVEKNEAAGSSGGAGIQAAQRVIDLGVEALATGNLGPKAAQVIGASGIRVYLGSSGTVEEVALKIKNGEMEQSRGPSVGQKHGME